MSPNPHTIGVDQSIVAARQLMRQHGIRHLVVLRGGKLVGLVSDRDLLRVAVGDVDLSAVRVEEAMTEDVFAVGPLMPLEQVLTEMADHKYGSVVVLAAQRVVGVFTMVDVARCFAKLLGAKRKRAARPRSSRSNASL
jgi:acetoin utilization protein AcuB